MKLSAIFTQFFSLFLSLTSAQNTIDITVRMPADKSTSPDTRPCSDPFVAHVLDSSIPAPTQFAWSASGATGAVAYDVSLSEDTLFDAADVVARGITDTMLPVWNLKINTPYFWKVTATDSLATTETTPVATFTTPDLWPRMIYVDGTTNVRDIGGRRNMDGRMIRQGLLFRSAEFNQTYPITPKGVEQLKRLGIVSEIDLRNSGENPLVLPMPLLRYLRPVTATGEGLLDYEYGLRTTPLLYGEVFRELAKSGNYPMVLHCRVGADRTGTVVALLEALIGCSEQQMGINYAWTSLSINGIRDTASDAWRGTVAYLKTFDTNNATVQAGAWYFLLAQGLTVNELITIRKIFTGDDRQPFSAISAEPRASASRLSRQHTARQFFPAQRAIVIGKGIRNVELYALSGRKIWEYSRNRSDTEEHVVVPPMARGVGILYYFDNKKVAPQ